MLNKNSQNHSYSVPQQYTAPLSHDQAGLWFIHQMNPENAAYHVVFAIRIYAEVDTHALEQTFQIILNRHAALRTTLTTENGEPVQHVHPVMNMVLNEVSIEGLSEAKIKGLVTEHTKKPFDLEKEPMFRVSLYTKSSTDHILVLTTHHIAVDFWSLGLILEDFQQLYPSVMESQKVDLPLPELPSDYLQHVYQQQEMLKGEEGEKLWKYWKNHLSSDFPTLNLPTDKPRPPLQSFNGASHAFTINEEVSNQLATFSRKEGVTLFMVLLAAYQVLLHRYTGQPTILSGTAMAGRTKKEFRRVIGNFVNTVILKADFSESITFNDFLAKTKATVIDAIKHQHLPFSLLVKQMKYERDPSRPPIVQTSFSWERLPQLRDMADLFMNKKDGNANNFGGLPVEAYPVCQQEGQFDINLEMGGEVNGALTGYFKYNTDLFHTSTIVQFERHFQELLRNIVKDPDVAIHKLAYIPEDELNTMLKTWNNTQAPFPSDKCLHQLFEEQVKQTPEAIAIKHENEQISYKDLSQKVKQLAIYLQQREVKPGALVGISVDRSIDMVVSMLAVLKAGGAYVPLDPAFPDDRLSFMIEDANLLMQITQEKYLDKYANLALEKIYIDKVKSNINNGESAFEEVKSVSTDLAYVIYTSGSTGKPKGVQIKHQSVVNFLFSTGQKPGINAQDVLLSVTTLSFDIAVLEIFLPLISGAQLVLVGKEIATDGYSLAAKIHENKVTIMQATPSTWRLLLEAGWKGEPGLKILTGGEAISLDLAQQLLARVDAVWNMYGPTETTIWSTTHKLLPTDSRVSIGRPLANTQLYVLDAHLSPVSVGVIGELYIGGDGLANGYLNRQNLTQERFIGNPFETSGTLMYKTGDLVKYLEDGNVEYVGRADHQVKLRGFRIELGEIEAVLRKNESIRDVIVKVREDHPNDKRLVAYYIPVHEEKEISASTLQNHLKQSLPEYMVPSVFVCMDEFPLTPNKKIDHKALPIPEIKRNNQEVERARDAAELSLVEMWESVLNIRPVGIHDNFFDLGGHSLLAVRIMHEIENSFGKNLPVSVLFQNPTIEQLATVLRENVEIKHTPVVSLKSKGTKPPLFCPHPIGGNVFCYTPMVSHLPDDQPVYGLQVRSLYEDIEPHVSIEDMALEYLDAIQEIQPHGPYHFAGWCFGGVVALEISKLLLKKGEEVALLAMLDSRAPILDDDEEFDDAILLSWFARDLAIPYGKTLTITPEKLREVGSDNMFNYVLDQAKKVNVLPQDAKFEQIYRFFQVYIANAIALQGYTPQSFPQQVHMLRAKDEPLIKGLGETLGWDKCDVTLEITDVPGNHSTMMYNPNAKAISEKLTKLLEEVNESLHKTSDLMV